MAPIKHFHPYGPDKVAELYGEDGLWFHLERVHGQKVEDDSLMPATHKELHAHMAQFATEEYLRVHGEQDVAAALADAGDVHQETADALGVGRAEAKTANLLAEYLPSDDEVEENLAEAIGPVPFSQWRLRTFTCDDCNRLSFVPATDAWQTVIREHAFSKHAETLLPD